MLTPTDADRRLAAIAAQQESVFTLADARLAGLTTAQIKLRERQSWTALYEGVFLAPGAARSWHSDLRAALAAAGPHAAVSHRAGAAVYLLPGGRRDLVELTCPRWRRTRHPGLVVHERRRILSHDTQIVDGITVTRPELVLLDLAALRPSPNYLEAVIHAARRQRLITYESTVRTFRQHARRGLKGVVALRVALERWDPHQRATESEMETALLQRLREHDLPEPVVQFEVFDEHGRFVARTDLGWPQWRATLDYDSKQEHSDEFQIARDERRRNAIAGAGYLPLVARLDDVRRSADQICDVLRSIARKSA